MSIERENASIFLCCLQYDGLKLKPALEYFRHHHSFIGLSSGLVTYEEMEEIRFMNNEGRRTKMVSLPFGKEDLEFIAESLDSEIALLRATFLSMIPDGRKNFGS